MEPHPTQPQTQHRTPVIRSIYMAVRVIRARNTDPVVTMPTQVTKAAAYCRVSTDSEEQESSYEAQVTL